MKLFSGRYGFPAGTVSLVLLCTAVFFSIYIIAVPLHAEDAINEAGYVETLLRDAEKKELHRDRYWHTLLHYKEAIGGVKSLVDDPKFFLSEKGRTDPREELRATIRAFFSPKIEGERHPTCRFVARYQWLKDRLGIDPARVPAGECAEIFQMVESLRPSSVILSFPTSHINSPASMFGHTLLTIETGNRSRLLAHAVNYSAITTDTFGPLYTVRGIFGFYHGYFSILPYYAKIQEYGDFDHRDIWEYRLNFNADEMRRMLYHIYELDNIFSYYYFFDENCSYSLLFLLDAARPGLALSDEFYSRFFTWVIPIDTIRGVERGNLIDSVVYRPSRVTTIRHIASRLSTENQRLALAIAAREKTTDDILKQQISTQEKILVCDLVSEYVRYQYSKGDITRAEYSDIFIKSLRTRATLGNPDSAAYTVPEPPRPEKGHLPARLAVGGGVRGDEPYQEVRLRPAYHVLLDPDDGFVEGGQIVFTDFAVRLYDREKKFELERWDMIDIISLSPRDRFIRSVSWKVNLGLKRRLLDDGDYHLVGQLNPGTGLAWKCGSFGIFYLFLEGEVDGGGDLDGRYSLGAGGSTGFIGGSARLWKFHLCARDLYSRFGEHGNEMTFALAQRFTISTNATFVIEARRTRVSEPGSWSTAAAKNEAGGSFNFFF